MAASYVGQLFTTPISSTTSSTTIAGNTSVAVSAGNTVFFVVSSRGGTTTAQAASVSGLPGDVVLENNGSGGIGNTQTSNSGSPAMGIIRAYFPTGMSSGTTVTITWVQSATRKLLDGLVWTGVANSTNQGHQVSTGSGGTSLGSGTTGATTTTTGVHVAAWGINTTASGVTYAPGADTEGTMNERTEALVGATNFQYLYAEDNTVTAAHAGGETALVTPTGTVATWVSAQGIWDGAAAETPQRNQRFRGSMPTPVRAFGPQMGWR